MKVLIDGTIYSQQASGGVSVYFSELIRFLGHQTQWQFSVNLFDPCIAKGIEDIRSSPSTRSGRARVLERYRSCRHVGGADVFHSSYYRRPAGSRLATVVTVHDFYYERSRKGLPKWIHSQQKFAAIRAAQSIICISQTTADDLKTFVGLRTDQSLYVIHNGVGTAFTPGDEAPRDSRQLLFVGRRGGSKNFALVLRMLKLLTEYRLVCVGGGPMTSDDLAGVPSDIGNRVKHHAYISDEALARLYRQSHCLLYPSSFEGFGIPVAEAMKCGCPVVGLRACLAVREVAGLALVGIDDEDPVLLKAAVESLQDFGLREKVIQAGFERSEHLSWNATHKQTVRVYEALAGRK